MDLSPKPWDSASVVFVVLNSPAAFFFGASFTGFETEITLKVSLPWTLRRI